MEASAGGQSDYKIKTNPESSGGGGGGDHHTSDYAPYPKLDPADVAPPPPPETGRSAPAGDYQATTMPPESNPYVTPSPAAPSSSAKSTPRHSLLSRDLDPLFEIFVSLISLDFCRILFC